MRKISIIMLIFVVSVTLLAACGGGGNTNEGKKEEQVSYKDGTWEGQSAKDERGAYGSISLAIKDNKITTADFEEIQEDGTPKGSDYQYQTSVEAQPKYEQELIEKQNPDEVDSVSGATATWNKFKEAAKAALDKAKK